jgi:predicted phosphodiesterase
LRIGIVSDIHCDVEALSRALDEMGPVDLLLGAGDFVLQYRFSNEIYDMLRDHRVIAVRGNHDQAIASPAGAMLRASGKIAPEHLERLDNMPSVVELHVEGKRIVMMHTSRMDPTGGGRDLAATALGKVVHHWQYAGHGAARAAHTDLQDSVLTDIYAPGKGQAGGRGQMVSIAQDDGVHQTYIDMPEARADILVVGHTHQPSISVESGTLVINPGSLGQPRNPAYPHRRTYAVLDTDGWSAEIGEFHQAVY